MHVVFAIASSTVAVGDGRHVTVNQGEHWPSNDPVVKAYPSLFTEDAKHGLRVSVPLDVSDDAEPEVPVDTNWQKIAELGYTPDEAVAIVEAAAARKKLDELKDGGDSSASKPEAPVEQATKAPGEKRTTRRG